MEDTKKMPVSAIMSDDVLSLYANATLEDAIGSLRDYGVSGAPVLDEGGEVIGVFSLADLARRDSEVEEGEAPRATSYFNYGLGEKLSLTAEDYDPEVFDRETVGDWMSPEIKSVTPDTTVAEVARTMVEEGVHRLVVTEGKKLRGIVTTFDVVRLLAELPEAEAAEKRAPKAVAKRVPARSAPKARARKRSTSRAKSRSR